MANSERSILSMMGRGFMNRRTSQPAEVVKPEDTNGATDIEPAALEAVFATEAAASPATAAEDSVPEQLPAPDSAVDRGNGGTGSPDEGPNDSGTLRPDGTPLNRVHVEYHAKLADPLSDVHTPEQENGGGESADDGVTGAMGADGLFKVSEELQDIFEKKVVTDPRVKALLERHGSVDVRELAMELRDFADSIGANDHRK